MKKKLIKKYQTPASPILPLSAFESRKSSIDERSDNLKSKTLVQLEHLAAQEQRVRVALEKAESRNKRNERLQTTVRTNFEGEPITEIDYHANNLGAGLEETGPEKLFLEYLIGKIPLLEGFKFGKELLSKLKGSNLLKDNLKESLLDYNTHANTKSLFGLRGNNFYRWKTTPNGTDLQKEATNGLFNKRGLYFMSYGKPWFEQRGGNTLVEFPYESMGKEVVAGTDAYGIPRIGTDIREIANGATYEIKTPAITKTVQSNGSGYIERIVKPAEWAKHRHLYVKEWYPHNGGTEAPMVGGPLTVVHPEELVSMYSKPHTIYKFTDDGLLQTSKFDPETKLYYTHRQGGKIGIKQFGL